MSSLQVYLFQYTHAYIDVYKFKIFFENNLLSMVMFYRILYYCINRLLIYYHKDYYNHLKKNFF